MLQSERYSNGSLVRHMWLLGLLLAAVGRSRNSSALVKPGMLELGTRVKTLSLTINPMVKAIDLTGYFTSTIQCG